MRANQHLFWGVRVVVALYRPAEEGGPGVKTYRYRFWGLVGSGWRLGFQKDQP